VLLEEEVMANILIRYTGDLNNVQNGMDDKIKDREIERAET